MTHKQFVLNIVSYVEEISRIMSHKIKSFETFMKQFHCRNSALNSLGTCITEEIRTCINEEITPVLSLACCIVRVPQFSNFFKWE